MEKKRKIFNEQKKVDSPDTIEEEKDILNTLIKEGYVNEEVDDLEDLSDEIRYALDKNTTMELPNENTIYIYKYQDELEKFIEEELERIVCDNLEEVLYSLSDEELNRLYRSLGVVERMDIRILANNLVQFVYDYDDLSDFPSDIVEQAKEEVLPEKGKNNNENYDYDEDDKDDEDDYDDEEDYEEYEYYEILERARELYAKQLKEEYLEGIERYGLYDFLVNEQGLYIKADFIEKFSYLIDCKDVVDLLLKWYGALNLFDYENELETKEYRYKILINPTVI
jgi:hypothetical protein